MENVKILVAIDDPRLVWEILENDPSALFRLIVLHKSNLPSVDPDHVGEKKWFRIEQVFDPLSDNGTDLVNTFSRKQAMEVPGPDSTSHIWIVASISAPEAIPMPGMMPGNKPQSHQ